ASMTRAGVRSPPSASTASRKNGLPAVRTSRVSRSGRGTPRSAASARTSSRRRPARSSRARGRARPRASGAARAAAGRAGRGGAGGERDEQPQRRLVGPLQVVERQQQRSLAGSPLERLDQRVEPSQPRGARVRGGRGGRGRGLAPGGAERAEQGGEGLRRFL